jgi:hypothetical protein
MPWGKKSSDMDQSKMTEVQKRNINKTQAAINAEAKRRVQTVRKTTSRDGNRGTR